MMCQLVNSSYDYVNGINKHMSYDNVVTARVSMPIDCISRVKTRCYKSSTEIALINRRRIVRLRKICKARLVLT